jgi:hypothetical protein
MGDGYDLMIYGRIDPFCIVRVDCPVEVTRRIAGISLGGTGMIPLRGECQTTIPVLNKVHAASI